MQADNAVIQENDVKVEDVGQLAKIAERLKIAASHPSLTNWLITKLPTFKTVCNVEIEAFQIRCRFDYTFSGLVRSRTIRGLRKIRIDEQDVRFSHFHVK